jgi:hypothetical protein
MGRLVRVPKVVNADLSIAGVVEGMMHPGGGLQPHVQTTVIADTYLERLGKYVPAEVLAFSIFINAILDQAMKSGGSAATMGGLPITKVGMVALAVGMVMTPIYVWYVREEGDAWLTNAVMSTLAFPFWAYALGAVAFTDFRDGNLAAILLASFTVFSGLVTPRLPRAKQKTKLGSIPVEGPRLVEPLTG